MLSTDLRDPGAVDICRLGETMNAQVLRFIESWNGDDAYDRFGSAGIGGQARLATQLTQHRRPALIAVNASGVVGLLDHVSASGATYFGIVVDSRFRKLSIGTTLVQTLLQSRSVMRPIIAECDHGNFAAVALLRGCQFKAIESDRYQITWRHE